MEDATMTYIGSVRPRVLVVGGPPTYLADSKVPRAMVEKGIRNLRRLAATIPLLLVEHHMLRDEQGWRLLSQIREQAKAVGNTVQTYAEYLGEEVRPLESQRQRLYSENPPSEEFQRWLQMPPREQGLIGSPTLWISLSVERSWRFTCSSPKRISVLTAVGVV
jgi:predicted metallo-beta-lactamase superfamily hydrolase